MSKTSVKRSQAASPGSSVERVAELGVVGAGGGGFPTAVKLAARVSTVIVNGAECEPLLHKDKELLHHLAEPMLRGLAAAMSLVGARSGIVGIKEKYTDVIEGLEPMLPRDVRILPLRDSYPAGDEFLLVYDAVGRVIPPGGLPKDVDAVVANVETLVNIGLDRPVILGEFPTRGSLRSPEEIVRTARRAGYAGALAWSALAGDEASDAGAMARSLRPGGPAVGNPGPPVVD